MNEWWREFLPKWNLQWWSQSLFRCRSGLGFKTGPGIRKNFRWPFLVISSNFNKNDVTVFFRNPTEFYIFFASPYRPTVHCTNATMDLQNNLIGPPLFRWKFAWLQKICDWRLFDCHSYKFTLMNMKWRHSILHFQTSPLLCYSNSFVLKLQFLHSFHIIYIMHFLGSVLNCCLR